MVQIKRLLVEDFRCWPRFETAVAEGAGVVALVGENGVGKTSLLEALSVLGGGKGLLGADAKEQLRETKGVRGWKVFAELDDGQTVAVGWDGKHKTCLVDGKAVEVGELARVLPLVWLAPRLDRLFFEEPAVRRGWLDEWAAMLDPAHAGAVGRWQRHKRARLKLLLENADADWVSAEERLAAEWGAVVLRGRVEFCAALAGEGVRLKMVGAALEILDAEDAVAALRGKLERSREIDARMGRTHAGPDTAVLEGEVLVDGERWVTMARASSGQHKRGLVRLVLAQARRVRAVRGMAPLVIIDELGAHLDAGRQAAVVEELVGLGCMVWVSDTEIGREGVFVVEVGQ